MALYAFDGTGDYREKPYYPELKLPGTNVVRFEEAYGGSEIFYEKGVGTTASRVGMPAGLLGGAGAKLKIKRAYKCLGTNYYEKDDKTIDIVGFSRGAATAIHFANVVAYLGVPDPTRKRPLIKRYSKQLGWSRWPRDRACDPPQIRFLGLWDTVASFGNPFEIGLVDGQRLNLFFHLTLPWQLADRCFHAMSLDERRKTFRLTRIDGAHEEWFRGVHRDVGGPSPERELSDLSLSWMIDKARSCGVPIHAGNLSGNADGALTENTVLRRAPRHVCGSDTAHDSVYQRSASAPLQKKAPLNPLTKLLHLREGGSQMPGATTQPTVTGEP